jgi:C1A family cysteine protease
MGKIYGLALTAEVGLESANSLVRVILVADAGEYLVYEGYPRIFDTATYMIRRFCEETCALDGIEPVALRIQVEDAAIDIQSIDYIDSYEKLDAQVTSRGVVPYSQKIKKEQDQYKIHKINEKNLTWVAEETSVSRLPYQEKKNLFATYVTAHGALPNLQGFEYYGGGIFELERAAETLFEATGALSDLPTAWDWRNVHGQNWVTAVKDQGQCGSCWGFAAVAATETLINLFYNQHLDMDLSEQDVLSCSGGGNCDDGGYYGIAARYIRDTGVVDEACFPYEASDLPCANKCTDPNETVKIAGYTGLYSLFSEEALKRFIIEKGAVGGSLYYWWHVMQLVGYGTVNEGDIIYFGKTASKNKVVGPNSKYIGQTYWLFKNSWGNDWGEAGFCNIILKIEDVYTTPMDELDSVFAVTGPIDTAVGVYEINCVDEDGDGYCNWGISDYKPDTCSLDCGDVKDCDDSDPSIRGCLWIECSDGVDNDGDGEIDAEDGGCDGTATDNDETDCGDGACEGGETPADCAADCGQPECNDGIDNDGDGAVDLDDAGCSGSTDHDETNCLDAVCEGGETQESCPEDCGYPNSCGDTDGGQAPTLLGTVSGYYQGVPYSETDYCIDGSVLREYYCITDNLHDYYDYDCSLIGRSCLAGQCQ